MSQIIKSFLRVLIVFFTIVLSGQKELQDNEVNELFKVIPKEKVYVHYNTSLLFSGEKLQYKLYFVDLKTKRLSQISKIGYVSLIGKDGVTVFSHKIKLENGTGSSDFFIPSSIPTGSYKLLAYSQWMRNQGIESFFQSNIQIINPYKIIPVENREVSKDSILATKNSKIPNLSVESERSIANNYINISLDKRNVGKRQKLVFAINSFSKNAEKGNYSVSIRKLNDITISDNSNINLFHKKVNRSTFKHEKNTIIEWIPELRGQLISGMVIDKESKKPVSGEKVFLSLPGANFLFYVATTNNKGDFYFNIDQDYNNTYGSLQIKSANNQDLDIILNKHSLNISGIEFLDFYISDTYKDFIKTRSLHNQIENAYVESKSDSIISSAKEELSFYRDWEVTYLLDDYTRFNSISETVIEIIDRVSLSNFKNGKRVFRVRPLEGYTPDNEVALVFIDGLYIQNHEDILDYSAKKLKSVSFSRDRCLIGTEIFQGILHFETIGQNYADSYYNPKVKNHTLFKPQPKKILRIQSYNSSKEDDSRIPDFRHQLLWIPELDIVNDKEVTFYSSDVRGEYEIVIEGFTSDGQPVSAKELFTVN